MAADNTDKRIAKGKKEDVWGTRATQENRARFIRGKAAVNLETYRAYK